MSTSRELLSGEGKQECDEVAELCRLLDYAVLTALSVVVSVSFRHSFIWRCVVDALCRRLA